MTLTPQPARALAVFTALLVMLLLPWSLPAWVGACLLLLPCCCCGQRDRGMHPDL
jgi:hypothetical protein